MTQGKLLYESKNVWDQDFQLGQINLARAIIDFFPEGVNKALDVGCGDGKLTDLIISETKVDISGLDASNEAVSRCSFPSFFGQAESMPFEDDEFDLVFTLDMLEHIPDHIVDQAWKEIFRVAKNWVMIAVPFRENLLDATAKCENCGELYHVNWHVRSYDWHELVDKCPEDYEVDKIILSGEAWTPYNLIETQYRRTVMHEYSGWDKAICPVCNTPGKNPNQRSDIPDESYNIISELVGRDMEINHQHREHSEVIVLYRKKEVSHQNINVPGVNSFDTSSMALNMDLNSVYDSFIPYPLYPRLVKGVDNSITAQFPINQEASSIIVVFKNDENFEGEDNDIIIEDRSGAIFYSKKILDDNKVQLSFKRDPIFHYYGLLLRLKNYEKIESIQFGTGQHIKFLSNHSDRDIGYKKLVLANIDFYIQVTKPMYLDSLSILYRQENYDVDFLSYFNKKNYQELDQFKSSHWPHILMLCHDQHIDRRILSQARSLIKNKCKVTLIGLSYTGNINTEYLYESGLYIVRVSLNSIIPNNIIYRLYSTIQSGVNLLSNFMYRKTKVLKVYNFIFKYLSKINWYIYRFLTVSRYMSYTMGDPLPFKKAFVEVGEQFRYDLVQVHDLPALSAGLELAQKTNVPLVYDAHEFYPEQRTFSIAQKRICRKEEKKITKHCSKIYTVNDSIAHLMEKAYKINRPITLINALDPTASFDQSKKYDLIHKKLCLDETRKVLLFQGGFSEYRNLENLILAMKFIKNTNIDLVMLGSGALEKELKRLASKVGLLDTRIFFMPAVTQDALLTYSASADVGIIPYPHVDLNSYYCTPNKLFEFIQAGLPILANNSPELQKFVEVNKFGVCYKMNNAQSIANSIDLIFSDYNKLDSYKRNIIKNQDMYAWSSVENIYLSGIFQVLGKESVNLVEPS